MSGISYLDEVWNPVTGCSGKRCKVRDRCWAKSMVKRFPKLHGTEHGDIFNDCFHIPFSEVQFHPDRFEKPLYWRKPRRIGVCFMGDLFDNQVPVLTIHQIFQQCLDVSRHTYFILTKQAKNMRLYAERFHKFLEPISNIYWGVSITDQEDADRMIPELLKISGKHWVSVEPMLGKIEIPFGCEKCGYTRLDELTYMDHYLCSGLVPNIDWIVLGCESGPGRRPCKLEWMVDVVEQCKAAEVPVFVKQVDLGKRISHDPKEWPEELRIQELPE